MNTTTFSAEALTFLEALRVDADRVNPDGYTAVGDDGRPVAQYDWSEGPDGDEVTEFWANVGADSVLLEMYTSSMEELYGTIGAWLLDRAGNRDQVPAFLAEVGLTEAGLMLEQPGGYATGYSFEDSTENPFFDWSAGDAYTREFEVGDGTTSVLIQLGLVEFQEFFAALGAWVHNHRAGVH